MALILNFCCDCATATENWSPPGDFIPAAERYGLMPLIDRWVVRHAFEILAARLRRASSKIATCAINLSGATFNDDGFVDYVFEQLHLHGIPPSRQDRA